MPKNFPKLGRKSSLVIEVEDIPLAEAPLPETDLSSLLEKQDRLQQVEFAPALPEKLVDEYQYNFLGGMYQAYADHRPFTISPEMIWLVIAQGFSFHIDNHKEVITDRFPILKEKQQLKIWHPKVVVGDPNSPWDEAIARAIEQMKAYVGEEYVDALQINFSGTTQLEKTTGDLTLLHAMRHFIRGIFGGPICGIPTIVLEGEAQDWDKILHKLDYLAQFELGWWVDEIKPLVQQIRDTYTQGPDPDFWRHIFKVHTRDDYGATHRIDGWITRFYPYDKDGNRLIGEGSTQKEFWGSGIDEALYNLPAEKKLISFIFQVKESEEGPVVEEIPMTFRAGFIGLSQDSESLTLRPEIGWFITRDRPSPIVLKQYWRFGKTYYFTDIKDLDKKLPSAAECDAVVIQLPEDLDAFPDALLQGEPYDTLAVSSKGRVPYPKDIRQLNCRKYVFSAGEGDTPDSFADLYRQVTDYPQDERPEVRAGWIEHWDFEECYGYWVRRLITRENLMYMLSL